MTHDELIELVNKADKTEEEKAKLEAHVDEFKQKTRELCEQYFMTHVSILRSDETGIYAAMTIRTLPKTE